VKKSERATNVAAVAAALLFGASLVAVRAAVHDVPPLTLAALRFAQAGVLLFLYLLLTQRATLRVRPGDLPYLALLGILFYTLFPIAFNTSLRYIPASRGAVLLASMPLWALLLSRLVVRDALSPYEIAGALASMAGIAIVFGPAAAAATGPHRATGDALMLFTALCGAVHSVMVKPMVARYPASTVTLYAMGIGTAITIPFAAVVEGMPLANIRGVGLVSLLAFIGAAAAVAFSLWTFALRRLSATRAAVYLNLNPTFAVLLSAMVLHERLTPAFAVGFLTVIGGVLIASRGVGRS
jgi:drug/metabolite transporter (DMT)-like permease